MAALTEDRRTPMASGELRTGGVAAETTVFGGSLVMRNAAGFLRGGAAAVDLVGVGRAEERAVNPGAAGDVHMRYRPGVFRFANSAASDEITAAHSGAPCYAVDDQTVAATDDGGARSIAGFVDHVDEQGVWVLLDEARARSHATLAAAIAALV